MFAVEINFADGITSAEMLLLRRSMARIGGSAKADVVIEGLTSPDLVIRRGLGHEFFCAYAEDGQKLTGKPAFIEGTYQKQANINLGTVNLTVMAIDADLVFLAENAKQGSISNVIKFALTQDLSRYPAVAVIGPNPIFVSVGTSNRFLIGKSRQCGLRLDSKDIEPEHLAITVEDGILNVEVLARTQNVLLDNHLLKIKSPWLANQRLLIGEVSLFALYSEEDYAKYRESLPTRDLEPHRDREEIILSSSSNIVSPQQIVLEVAKTITIGRDPTNDVWINAGHISRYHSQLTLVDENTVLIKDMSSNGVFVEGQRLPLNKDSVFPCDSLNLDFKQGIILSVNISVGCQKSSSQKEQQNDILLGESKDTTEPDNSVGPEIEYHSEIDLNITNKKADINDVFYHDDNFELNLPMKSTRPVFWLAVFGLSVLFALIALGLFNS